MTVEEALTHVDYAGPSDRRDTLPCTVVAAKILAAEVRRLRAGVEAVRALPRFDLDGGYDDQCGVSRANCSDGAYMDADDVLAALEITDD